MDHRSIDSMKGFTLPEVMASRYRLDSWLGAGGMAEVFVATDLVLARVNHPNVVPVFDAIEDGGRPFLVMELVDGITLRDALDRKTGFAPLGALGIASGIAAGLAAVHEQGIVHRDLKPSNVFLTTAGAVKIGDFGIARAASAQRRSSPRASSSQASPSTSPTPSPPSVTVPPADSPSEAALALVNLVHEMGSAARRARLLDRSWGGVVGGCAAAPGRDRSARLHGRTIRVVRQWESGRGRRGRLRSVDYDRTFPNRSSRSGGPSGSISSWR